LLHFGALLWKKLGDVNLVRDFLGYVSRSETLLGNSGLVGFLKNMAAGPPGVVAFIQLSRGAPRLYEP
jgi:hypothetical protein